MLLEKTILYCDSIGAGGTDLVLAAAKKRAKEMGYRYEDVQISADSGITADGTLLLRVEPKPGAEKTHAT